MSPTLLQWRSVAHRLAEILDAKTPPPNCSCRLHPPCNDCIDHGGSREVLADFDRLVKEDGAAESFPPV